MEGRLARAKEDAAKRGGAVRKNAERRLAEELAKAEQEYRCTQRVRPVLKGVIRC